MKKITDYFFMRNGFETFRLEPDKHSFLLFGKRDRTQRDHLLDHLLEASYSLEGYKSVVLGDYGRGKTHQSKNIEYEINRNKLNLYPIYVKCIEFKVKEQFSTFFKELLLSIPTEEIKSMSQAYIEKVSTGEAPPMRNIVEDEDIALVFQQGLASPNLNIVRLSLRWLGGEQKLKMDLIGENLPSLQTSRQFGSVMKGIVQLFKTIKGKVPVYMVDEAERFQLITNPDCYWSWLAALRELTDIVGVAFIFFIGAKSRDQLPIIFMQDEVMTRIGVSNYVEFYNQGREDLKDFLIELMQTIIRKGPVPDALKPALLDKIGEPLDEKAPEELLSILNEHGQALETYPFTSEAFEQFIEQCAVSELSNKPREALIRIQKAAARAMHKDSKFIDGAILEEISRDGI